MCGAYTTGKEWGVPICNEVCKKKFMFYDAMPGSLEDALKIVAEKEKAARAED
jgi:hypothetical protein